MSNNSLTAESIPYTALKDTGASHHSISLAEILKKLHTIEYTQNYQTQSIYKPIPGPPYRGDHQSSTAANPTPNR